MADSSAQGKGVKTQRFYRARMAALSDQAPLVVFQLLGQSIALRKAAFVIQGAFFRTRRSIIGGLTSQSVFPRSVTFTVSSVFTDVVAERPCLKRKRSIALSAELATSLAVWEVRPPPLPRSLTWWQRKALKAGRVNGADSVHRVVRITTIRSLRKLTCVKRFL